MRDDGRPDAALLAGAARGDAAAFGVLVRRYIRPATLLAAQLVGDRDDAEDVVQDAFGVVYRGARGFDAERPFTPWFYAIVRRLAANRRAREARRARLLRWFGGKQHVPPPDAALEARARIEEIRDGMRALPPMQRACFELVALRDLSVAEVAAVHGISDATVRQHVFRARATLRSVLKEVE